MTEPSMIVVKWRVDVIRQLSERPCHKILLITILVLRCLHCWVNSCGELYQLVEMKDRQ